MQRVPGRSGDQPEAVVREGRPRLDQEEHADRGEGRREDERAEEENGPIQERAEPRPPAAAAVRPCLSSDGSLMG